MDKKIQNDSLYRFAAFGFCTIFIGAGGYIILRYALPVLIPFLFAYFISIAIKPLILWVRKHSKMGYKPICAIIITLILLGIGVGIFFIGSRLFRELKDFFVEMTATLDEKDNFIRKIIDLFEGMQNKIPLLSNLGDNGYGDIADSIYSMSRDFFKNSLTSASSAITSATASVITSLPGVFFGIFVSLISLYYFSFDPTLLNEKLSNKLKKILPKKTVSTLEDIKLRILISLGAYVKAYVLLMFIIFAELFVGFMIINIEYALMLAVIIALFDLMPILGAGGIILPWGIFLIISGNYFQGVGLLILYAVMYVFRQIAEPKIVGSFIGIHPLASLFAIYAGLKIFGVFGMIIAPIIVFTVKSCFEERKI